MAKKPSPAELKKEGEELGKQFAEMRKKEHNFAMQIGKEGLVFQVDKRKPPEALWRIAKKDGGSSKGAMGVVTMNGKVMELDCVDPDSVPTNLAKLARVYFKERGQPAKIVIKGQPDEDVDDDDAEDGDAVGQTGATAAAADAGSGDAAPADTAEVPAEEETASAASVPAEEETASADSAGSEKSLLEEFEELKPDVEACMASGNAGLAKKVGGLNTMFEAQVEGNPKKAAAILGLLKTTLDTAREAGDFVIAVPGGAVEADPEGTLPTGGEEAGGAPASDDPAVAERRNKIAELERGVDALLAEFA